MIQGLLFRFLFIFVLLQPVPASKQVSIYPNPVTDRVYIRMPHPSQARAVILRTNGEIFTSKSFSGRSKISLDMRNCSPGMYLLHISDKGKITAYQLIKR